MTQRELEILLKKRGISLSTYREIERNVRPFYKTEEEIEQKTLKNINENLAAIKLGEIRRRKR